MSRLLLPILYLTVSVGLFFTWIDPLYKEVQADRQEYQVLQELNIKATSLREKRNSLLSKYTSISDSVVGKLVKLLPDNADNVELLRDISIVAATHGLFIKDISLGDDTSGRPQKNVQSDVLYGTTDLSFSVDARYPDFMNFLYDLEQNVRLVDVQELEVTTHESLQGFQVYTLKVRTYWLI